MNKERPKGWYWCRDNESWEVARWNGEMWILNGHTAPFTDRVWDEVIEDRLYRPGTVEHNNYINSLKGKEDAQ